MNSPQQKKSDGIRRVGAGEPIRLSPRRARPETPPLSPVNETELRWEDEGSTEKLHEIRTSGALGEESASEDTAIIHEPFSARPRRARLFWGRGRRAPGMAASVGRDAANGIPPGSWGRRGAYLGGIAIALAFVLISTVFARVTVVVKPRVDEASFTRVGALFDASVSKVLFSQKVIPAETLRFSRTVAKDFPATGTARVEERARGKISVFNAFNSSPQPLIAGTRFMTEAGTMYRIQKPVTVPAARIEEGKVVPQSAEAEAVADAAGEGANLPGPVSLKLPGFQGTPRYLGFYATAEAGFSGGFRGEATVVSKDDLARAEEETTKAVFGDLEKEMARTLPAGLSMIKELREIEIIKIDAPKAGARSGQTFTARAEAKGTIIAFRESDVTALLISFAAAENENSEFIPGSARLSYAVKSIDFEKGRAEVEIGGGMRIRAKISERELAALIVGKKEGSAAELLKARQELASFRLSFFPPWRAAAPKDPAKIRIRAESP